MEIPKDDSLKSDSSFHTDSSKSDERGDEELKDIVES